MSLLEQINEDLKQAMRDKAAEKLSVLRMLSAAFKNKKIELGNKEELTDEQAVAVIKSEVKKRKDSIESYEAGGRTDLADQEKFEITILEKYMPEQMSEEKIEEIARQVITDGGFTQADFGRAMGAVMQAVKGQADGGQVSAVVKKVLAG